MNDVLSQAVAQPNLQAGQRQRIQVDGYEFEIRRVEQKESTLADGMLLEPWVWFPDAPARSTRQIKQGAMPLPDRRVLPPAEDTHGRLIVNT
jgi:hypothetical protein